MDKASLKDIGRFVRALLTNPAYGPVLACLVVLGDAVLTQLVIRFVRYTEIDWETYMYQIELYMKGERNYAEISGPTGPLVYPAGHVYIHEVLHKITSSGLNIRLAQQIYGGLYVVSLALTCIIYIQAGNIPNWSLFLLPLSKRLHSIYALRLFNDCWAVMLSEAAMLALGGGWLSTGTILFSLAISVKMSVLLYLPGVLVVLWLQRGILYTILHMSMMLLFQVILAKPFLEEHPWQYLSGAFDISRIFLFKWTVNWRFLGEDTFLSPIWAKLLLLGHVCTLLAFANFKWCKMEGGIFRFLRKTLTNVWERGSQPVSADFVTTVLMTSNLIGIVFARSLHYQFYSWYAQQIPFLTWRTRYPVVIKLGIICAIEYAWNVFPSTDFSSALLVATNMILLVGIWFGWPAGHDVLPNADKKYQ